MYVAQKECVLAYAGFWTEQIRNPHDYMIDFESEVQCFLQTEKLVKFLRETSRTSLTEIYSGLVDLGICEPSEIALAAEFEKAMLGILSD